MQKEIARRLMKTEWVQKLLQEEPVREIFEDWTIHSLGQGLKPEGKPRYDDFFNSLKKGEQISLSDYIDMFIGFDFESGIKGLENLVSLKGEPMLLAANHTNNGPIRGGWQYVLISYYLKQTTGKEIRPLHGFDPTTTQDLFRERLYKSINSIPVRDSDRRSASLLRQAITNRDSMLLYPEGDGSRNLRRGLPNAGRLIQICASRDMNVVSCSAGFRSDTFFLTFDTLDSKDIERSAEEGNDRYAKGQDIVDYAMQNIAKHLPENRRGYYQ